MSSDVENLMEQYPENFTEETLKMSRVLTPDQEEAEHKSVTKQLDTLRGLAAPLVAWIRENHDLHTEVCISWDRVSVKHDGMGIPFPYSEK